MEKELAKQKIAHEKFAAKQKETPGFMEMLRSDIENLRHELGGER